jgi:predicted nucleic acid-binding protein
LAFELLVRHRLASALGIPDCLVAATALARSGTLYTFNLKHFRVIGGLDVQEPYSRS